MTYEERRDYYRRIKHCTRCGKKDAYTMMGRALCYECEEKKREYSREHYKKYGNPSRKRREQRLKELGLCIDCGKRHAEPGKIRCRQCLNKNNAAHKKSKKTINRDVVVSLGLCYLCCKRPTAPGKKLCEECYTKASKNIKKASNVVLRNRMDKRLNGGMEMGFNYNTSTMEKCEYIDSMNKYKFEKPNQENGKCDGYKNKYSGGLSKVCQKCGHLRGERNDF